jgi:hypothetical protein
VTRVIIIDADSVSDAVEETIRTVVAQEALPLFGRLADSDISQKTGPLDLVTVADRRCWQPSDRSGGGPRRVAMASFAP